MSPPLPEVSAPNHPPFSALAGRLPESELSLLDLVDHLLNRGVALSGDAVISVAGVDLVYLGLNLVLASVETLRGAAREGVPTEGGVTATPAGYKPQATREGGLSALSGAARVADDDAARGAGAPAAPRRAEARDRAQPLAPPDGDAPTSAATVALDPDNVDAGLARLVLTVVELIRQALERQAVRRMDGGGLSEAEIERLGLALLRLREKLHELAAAFGLRPEDLNIDLGPLGNLL